MLHDCAYPGCCNRTYGLMCADHVGETLAMRGREDTIDLTTEVGLAFLAYWEATHDFTFSPRCHDMYERNAVKFFVAGWEASKQPN